MQPFGREILAIIGRHARTTAVAITEKVGGVGEVKSQGRPVIR